MVANCHLITPRRVIFALQSCLLKKVQKINRSTHHRNISPGRELMIVYSRPDPSYTRRDTRQPVSKSTHCSYTSTDYNNVSRNGVSTTFTSYEIILDST